MAERVAVRDITNEEGRKPVSIVRRGSGSVVRWRRAYIVLRSAQRMDVPAIAEIAFTSEGCVKEVIHNFNADGFHSLAAKYSAGRPPKFTLPERREIKKVALSRPVGHPALFHLELFQVGRVPVPRGRSTHQPRGSPLGVPFREEGVSFQVIKTYKTVHRPRLRSEEEQGARALPRRRNVLNAFETAAFDLV